jgi:hypothetical protein
MMSPGQRECGRPITSWNRQGSCVSDEKMREVRSCCTVRLFLLARDQTNGGVRHLAAEGFTLLAIDHERVLTLGSLTSNGAPEMTWTFVLDEVAPHVTRLLVRARGGPGYRFFGLPVWLMKPIARVVHFVRQRKQLLGIASRAERQPADRLATVPAPRRDAA